MQPLFFYFKNNDLEIVTLNGQLELEDRPVVTVGMFDGVHIGHRKLLSELVRRAKENGCKSVVMTFDRHPQHVLANGKTDLKILQNNAERFDKIASTGVDYLCVLHFTDGFAHLLPSEFLDRMKQSLDPQLVLLGYDNRFGRKNSSEFDEILAAGHYGDILVQRTDSCVFCNSIEVSSTQIRKALERGEIDLANRMLGSNYVLSGRVVEGNRIGRQLGFPTANLKVEELKLIPAKGVYAVMVSVDNRLMKGMLSIGTRPTLGLEDLSVEVNIFGFSQQIYNKTVSVEFIEYIRSEKKFGSLEQLKQQLCRDRDEAERILACV